MLNHFDHTVRAIQQRVFTRDFSLKESNKTFVIIIKGPSILLLIGSLFMQLKAEKDSDFD